MALCEICNIDVGETSDDVIAHRAEMHKVFLITDAHGKMFYADVKPLDEVMKPSGIEELVKVGESITASEPVTVTHAELETVTQDVTPQSATSTTTEEPTETTEETH